MRLDALDFYIFLISDVKHMAVTQSCVVLFFSLTVSCWHYGPIS